jgi:hypothetical protein
MSNCNICGNPLPKNKFIFWYILAAILFFPVGTIIVLFLMLRKRSCPHCDASRSKPLETENPGNQTIPAFDSAVPVQPPPVSPAVNNEVRSEILYLIEGSSNTGCTLAQIKTKLESQEIDLNTRIKVAGTDADFAEIKIFPEINTQYNNFI